MSLPPPTHLLGSDVIIWVLRSHPPTLDLIKKIAQMGVPACSPVSVIEVLLGATPEEEERTRELLSALRLLPVDRGVAERAAEYIKTYQDRKDPDFADAIIAATAVVHDLTLVTYNRQHYPMRELKLYPIERGV